MFCMEAIFSLFGKYLVFNTKYLPNAALDQSYHFLSLKYMVVMEIGVQS